MYNCKKCECYDHADRCVYDATVDPFPDSYEDGSGGVCVDCRSVQSFYLFYTPLKVFTTGRRLEEKVEKGLIVRKMSMKIIPFHTVFVDFQTPNTHTKICTCLYSNFRHNTQGRFCSECKDLFYRPKQKSLYAEDVCSPCACYDPGLLENNHICQKVILHVLMIVCLLFFNLLTNLAYLCTCLVATY